MSGECRSPTTVTFDVPPGFATIGLGAEEHETPDVVVPVIAVRRLLPVAGVVFAATALVQGGIVGLVMSLAPGPPGPQDEAAEALAGTFGSGGSSTELRRVTLPCGPAIGVVARRDAEIIPGRGSVPSAVFQVFIPVHQAQKLLVVSLSTPSPMILSQCAEAMIRTVRSIRFEGGEGSDDEAT